MTKKTVKSLIAVLMLLTVCLYFISGTYARYTSSASGTAEVQVAKWAVKVNDTDIVEKDTITISFTEVANDNVVDGKIAPASQLYADFTIDPTGSEVAIDYSFSLGNIESSSGTVPTSLTVSKVVPVVSGTEGTALTATDGKYTGTINLTSQTAELTSAEAVTVRVYVEWTNSEANNTTDTTVGASAPTLTMDVTAVATQHIG